MRTRFPSTSADIGRSRDIHSAAKGPCEGTKGAVRAATRTARNQDRGVPFRGERFGSPYTCSVKRPSPQDDPLHHGNTGIGQSLKMKRLPPPLPHGRFPFGAPTRPPWKGSPLRLCRVLSADPVPSKPRLREAVGSPFKMCPPIAAAHARCDETIPQFIDRTAPPTKGFIHQALYTCHRGRARSDGLDPMHHQGGRCATRRRRGPMNSDVGRRGPQLQENEEAA